MGFNYCIDGLINGYITVATHTREVLVKEVTEGGVLPNSLSKIYYLSDGEIYFEKDNSYYTLDGTINIIKMK